MEKNENKKKFKLSFPDTSTLLIILIVISAICTYIVPAGEFERAIHEGTGRTVVVPGTYTIVESNPTSFMTLLQSIYNGMMDASDIAWFIFAMSFLSTS